MEEEFIDRHPRLSAALFSVFIFVFIILPGLGVAVRLIGGDWQ